MAPGPPAREDQTTNLVAVRLELRVELQLDSPRSRQVDRDDTRDAPGPRRHDHDFVSEQDRFGDRVGDEENGLASRFPDSQQFETQLFAGHRVERTERLVHQQKALGRAATRGRWPRAVASRPTAREGAGSRSGKAAQRQQLERTRPVAIGAQTEHVGREQHVVEHGAPGQEHRMLEDDPDVGKGLTHHGVTDAHGPAAHQREPATSLSKVDLPQPLRPNQRDDIHSRRCRA